MAERDREQEIDRLLRRLSAIRTPRESCLDAETLAAWIDGGLTQQERERAELHLSECSRCQATIAAVGRSEPVPAAPEPWWRRHWAVGWLVPVTAAAAAAVLWIAVPYRNPGGAGDALSQLSSEIRRPESSAPVSSTRAVVPSPAPVPEQAPSAVADSAAKAVGQIDRPQVVQNQLKEESIDRLARPQASVERDQQREREVGARTDRDLGPAREAARSEPAGAAGALGGAAVGGTVPSRQATAAAPRLATSAPPQAAPAPRANVLPPAAPAAASQAALGRAENIVVGGAVPAEFAPSVTVIVSPDSKVQWRIVRSRSIEYSTNSGGSWEALSLSVVADLTSGAAPSSSVCWIVGRGGTVLRTIDGRRWERLPFSDASDLTAVQAADGRRATVTTASGTRFSTADGGQTWTPLQDF